MYLLKDSEGITFNSAKNIYMKSEGDIKIISENKMKLSGNELAQISRKNQKLTREECLFWTKMEMREC